MTQREYSSGISGCHYAVRGGSMLLKSLPGAIKLSFKPSSVDRSFIVRGETNVYSYTASRKCKERRAELEIVSLTKDFLVDVLGYIENQDGSLTAGVQPDVHISLFYETENGGRPVRHQLFDCMVCFPTFDASTLGNKLTADVRKLEIVVNPDFSGNRVTNSNYETYSRKIAKAANAALVNSWFGLME